MVRVLVVDDSPVAQALLVHVLSSDPGIRVIGTAANGTEALAALARDKPDVVTMDLHMHGMDGFAATRRIMAEHPLPVVIVSGSIDPRADATIFSALEVGAVAILLRPPGVGHAEHSHAAAQLIQTVKTMSEVKVVRRFEPRKVARPPAAATELPVGRQVKLVAMGASTGGPVVMKRILSALPRHYPVPLVLVQHMAEGFVEGFAEWLSQSCAIRVKVGVHGEALHPGIAYVGPTGFEMAVNGWGRIELSPGDSRSIFCPTVSHLFRSVAQHYGAEAVGVLLTGMGADGAAELKAMREKGALTIAQDQASCVVYGMPGAAVKLEAAQHVLPPDGIIRILSTVVAKR